MPDIDAKKIEELLPCPFCGGAAQAEHFESKLGRWRWSIGCNDHTSKADDGGEPAAECYGFQSMTSFATKAEAIAAWNRRATPSLAGGDVEGLYAWDRIFADNRLATARRHLSADNIVTIIKHVQNAMWRPIETLQGGELDFVLARTADGRVMQWRASMLARNLKGPTPDHLSFPAIEWMPAPLKNPQPLSGGNRDAQ